MLLFIIFFLLFVIAFFDIYWVIRLWFSLFISKILPRIGLREKCVTYNMCWTTDIDFFCHMNNARYFREMDLGRLEWFFQTGCLDYIRRQTGMIVVQHGATIRYRRSIKLFTPFKLVPHIVYWDEKAMYFEQKFVSMKDEQVYAIAIIRSSVIGVLLR